MVCVAVEGFAEFGDGCVAVAHDVVVNGFVLDVVGRFEVLCCNAETAV